MKDFTLTESLPGETLRTARRSRGLSLQYIAKELRLTVATIEAMESDDYHQLPATIFVQGYIRNYAHLLGLDAGPFLAQFGQLSNQQVTNEFRPVTQISRSTTASEDPVLPAKSLSYVVVVSLVGIALIIIYSSSTTVPNGAQQDIQSVASKAKQMRVIDRDKLGSGDYSVSSIPVDRKKIPEKQPKPASVAVAEKAGDGKKAADNNKVNVDVLSIRFMKDTYVEVVDANNRSLLSHMGKRGFRDKVKGKAPFKVILSRPDHIEVHLNGKIFKHIKSAGRSAGKHEIIVRD